MRMFNNGCSNHCCRICLLSCASTYAGVMCIRCCREHEKGFQPSQCPSFYFSFNAVISLAHSDVWAVSSAVFVVVIGIEVFVLFILVAPMTEQGLCFLSPRGVFNWSHFLRSL